VARSEAPTGRQTPAARVATFTYPPGIRGLLARIGLAAATREQADFRDAAVKASRTRLVGRNLADVTQLGVSLCLPVDERDRCYPHQIVRFALAAWCVAMSAVPCAILLLGIAASIENSEGGRQAAAVWGGIGIALLPLALVYIMAIPWFKKRYAAGRLLTRPGALFQSARGANVFLCGIEDAMTYHVRKPTPDDIALCMIDSARRLLLIEGCTHRYVIHAHEIDRLSAIESGPRILLELSCRVGSELLSLVLYRDYVKWHMLNPLLTQNAAARFVKKLRRELGLQ